MSINKKHVMAGMLASAMVIPLAGATDSYANETRTTTANVNFRTGAGTNHSSMGIISKGKTVTYLETSGSWIKVQYNSKTGYVHGDYLTSGSGGSNSDSTSTTVKYVKASSGLNVRKGPSTSYAKVTKLANGTKVNVITTSGDWSKITYGNVTGYVSNAYLSSTPSTNVDDSNDNNQATSIKYVKSGAGLNVRKGPSTSYAKVTTIAAGTQVTVHSTSNGWSKITTGSVTGYVSSTYLTDTQPSNPNDDDNSGSQTQTTKYVNASAGLNIRSGAGTNYSKVGKLAHGTQVTVHSTSNGWSKISSGNVSGYASSTYLTSTKPSVPNDNPPSDSNGSTTDRASKVISYAKQQLGKPYVWGAQGPSSFDCSGFTYYIFKNSLGINLPRTSSMQSNYGTAVSKSNLQPGDLIFFDTVGSNNGGVTHCGMYIGGGQMIHSASGQGKVVINNINSSYYQNAWVNARRVL